MRGVSADRLAFADATDSADVSYREQPCHRGLVGFAGGSTQR